MNYFLLDGHEAKETDQQGWIAWSLEQANPGAFDERKRVALDHLPNGISVSTVFLGLNHSFRSDGPPIVFESMAFDHWEPLGQELDCKRYSTWAEAEAGHKQMVRRMKRRKAAG